MAPLVFAGPPCAATNSTPWEGVILVPPYQWEAWIVVWPLHATEPLQHHVLLSPMSYIMADYLLHSPTGRYRRMGPDDPTWLGHNPATRHRLAALCQAMAFRHTDPRPSALQQSTATWAGTILRQLLFRFLSQQCDLLHLLPPTFQTDIEELELRNP